MRYRVTISLVMTLNVISHFGSSNLPLVVAQPGERHANGIASVLEWCMTDTEHTTSGSNEEEQNTKRRSLCCLGSTNEGTLGKRGR